MQGQFEHSPRQVQHLFLESMNSDERPVGMVEMVYQLEIYSMPSMYSVIIVICASNGPQAEVEVEETMKSSGTECRSNLIGVVFWNLRNDTRKLRRAEL